MNNQKRKELSKASALLEEAKGIIESVLEDEQDGFDNMTESLQQTERGQMMEEAISNMECAVDAVDEAISYVEDASM